MASTKHERVSESILQAIASGELREGDRLPSESEFAAIHQVSVGTIQKTLAKLEHTGVLRREHGRGTFISGHKVAPADVRYIRFMDDQCRELTSYVHAKGVKRLKRKGPWSEFLGGEGFVRVDRVISVGGRFDLYSEFWLREDDFAHLGKLDKDALERNLREMLQQRLSLPTVRVDQWIRFDNPPQAAARELGLDEDTPAFIMELRGYTVREQPLYYQMVCSGPFSERLIVMR
jgi:DNA-binding GntR family transcriptional regulator